MQVVYGCKKEQGSEKWSASFVEQVGGNVEAWNSLSPDERLGFCASVTAGKAKCGSKGGSKARSRSRSRSGGGGTAKTKKRSKKRWTCYTHFFVEKLEADAVKLSRVSCTFSFNSSVVDTRLCALYRDFFQNNINNNNNKQTFSKRQINLKSRTGARGGYNQKHANH